MKPTRASLWLLISFMFFLSSCASTEKRAGEKLEAGEFDEAVALYERVVARDPKNAEAQGNLKRAREGVIGARLIQVRNLRTASSSGPALDKLLEVVELERKWNAGPTANAQFTQNEETGFAIKYFLPEMENLLKARRPLLAEHRFRIYSPVFDGKEYAPAMNRLKGRIHDHGVRHCGDLRDTLNDRTPYTNAFARDYCAFWGNTPKKLPASENARLATLYSGVAIEGDLQGVSSADVAAMNAKLSDALRASSWYDGQSRAKLVFKSQGQAAFDHQKNLVNLVHEYSADEPYQTTEMVTKTRAVPYFNAATNKMDTRQESYQELATVTKHRSVTRQYPYSALRHQQRFMIRYEAHGQLGNDDLTLSLSETQENSSDEHHLTVSDVGLAPQNPTLLVQEKWLSAQGDKLRAQLAEKLASEWMSQNCSSFGGEAGVEHTEKVLRCSRDPRGAQIAAVGEWYQNMFGLDAGTTRSLIEGAKKK